MDRYLCSTKTIPQHIWMVNMESIFSRHTNREVLNSISYHYYGYKSAWKTSTQETHFSVYSMNSTVEFQLDGNLCSFPLIMYFLKNCCPYINFVISVKYSSHKCTRWESGKQIHRLSKSKRVLFLEMWVRLWSPITKSKIEIFGFLIFSHS